MSVYNVVSDQIVCSENGTVYTGSYPAARWGSRLFIRTDTISFCGDEPLRAWTGNSRTGNCKGLAIILAHPLAPLGPLCFILSFVLSHLRFPSLTVI